jgi:hypothetical protein
MFTLKGEKYQNDHRLGREWPAILTGDNFYKGSLVVLVESDPTQLVVNSGHIQISTA